MGMVNNTNKKIFSLSDNILVQVNENNIGDMLALDLRKRTEEAVSSGSRYRVEKLREEIYGRRKGLTLYSEVEEELEFLRKYARKSPKRYLGRSISVYKKSKLKRIASWRAGKIKDDCEDFIGQRSQFALLSIPKSHARVTVKPLVSVLRYYLVRKTIDDEYRTYERIALKGTEISRLEKENKELKNKLKRNKEIV